MAGFKFVFKGQVVLLSNRTLIFLTLRVGLLGFNPGFFREPLVIDQRCFLQRGFYHRSNFIWRHRGRYVLHQHLQQRARWSADNNAVYTISTSILVNSIQSSHILVCIILSTSILVYNYTLYYLVTRSSSERVDLRAPSGRPKGKQNL